MKAQAPAFDLEVQTLIIGAGAAGLAAALAAKEAGEEVLVIEADPVPSGSTALSAGLIPAVTRFQTAAGIEDTAERFVADIQKKAKNQNDPALVAAMAATSGNVIEWLADRHGLPFSVVTDFDYPGHSRRRMHGLPSRSGRELIDRLRFAAEAQGIDIVTNRRAESLFTAGNRALGIAARGPGGLETIGCARLILACNGYGGNRGLVARHMPEIEGALWFGHPGNQGEAITWAQEHGLATSHLGAYQGHGNVAHPHGILISWAVIMEGGIQVNLRGERFWDESQGYSEAARAVLAQPEGVAWAIFDARIAAIARQFEDFKQAESQGAIRMAQTISELSEVTGLPAEALTETLAAIPQGGKDAFGRDFGSHGLEAPFVAVKVTGALFHTQGGLVIDPATARVRRISGELMENLYAVGGAACGVSGAGDSGYLSGNGLLSAFSLGWIAGNAAHTVLS
jgi:fumarate reductase flavoprotein subunit